MNVKFNGGGTFIFPNTFVDLPKTRRVWAKRGFFGATINDHDISIGTPHFITSGRFL